MSGNSATEPFRNQEPRVLRKDLFLLPVIGFATIAFWLFSAEAAARHKFATQQIDSCLIDDAKIARRYRPNCTAPMKTGEGPWTTNVYNDCGYRTKESCGPKPPGSTRIALLGSSVAQGLYIPYEETFATRTAAELTRRVGHHVEVQNLGREDASTISVFQQTDEALALKPDLVVYAIDPYDIEHLNVSAMPNRLKPTHPPHHGKAKPGLVMFSSLTELRKAVQESSAAIALMHYYFQDSTTFVRLYLHGGDHADYLRVPLTPVWQKRIEAFDVLLGEMAAKCDAAHVPFVLLEVPSLAQASLLKMHSVPPGVDPYQLSSRLQAIAARHQIEFVSTLDSFKNGPAANQTFYVFDTHANSEGHALVSNLLVKSLMRDESDALTVRNVPPPGLLARRTP